MPPDPPDVSGSRHDRVRIGFGDRIGRIGLVRFCANRELGEGDVDLGRFKSGQREIEVQLQLREIPELKRQQLTVPTGGLRNPVVGDDIGPDVRLAHLAKTDRRDLFQSEPARRKQAAMAGHDAVVLIDKHRIGEAEMPD